MSGVDLFFFKATSLHLHTNRAFSCSQALVQALQQERLDVFSELVNTMELAGNRVGELLGAHESSLGSQVEGQIHRLEQEVAQLHWKHEELSGLANVRDHICFLKVKPEVGCCHFQEKISDSVQRQWNVISKLHWFLSEFPNCRAAGSAWRHRRVDSEKRRSRGGVDPLGPEGTSRVSDEHVQSQFDQHRHARSVSSSSSRLPSSSLFFGKNVPLSSSVSERYHLGLGPRWCSDRLDRG